MDSKLFSKTRKWTVFSVVSGQLGLIMCERKEDGSEKIVVSHLEGPEIQELRDFLNEHWEKENES